MPPIDYNLAKGRAHDESIPGGVAVVPSDSVDLPFLPRCLWVSVAGSVKVTYADGMDVTYPVLTAGRHPMRVTRVWQTGTTATGMVAEY